MANDITTAAPNILSSLLSADKIQHIDTEKLAQLLAMQERLDARQAEHAFNTAMSAAQSEMQAVTTDRNNAQTKSRYATYAKLDSALRPIYTKNGFALSFNTSSEALEGWVRMLCYVSHNAGHTRTYTMDMPADGKGAKGGDVMTKTHAVGSGATYGMRYLLKMIFNVAVTDESDDDGNGSSGDPNAAWFSAIEECTTEAQVISRMNELVEGFGNANKVPSVLRSACQRKRETLKGKSNV